MGVCDVREAVQERHVVTRHAIGQRVVREHVERAVALAVDEEHASDCLERDVDHVIGQHTPVGE